MAESYSFDSSSTRRIAQAVRRVEQMDDPRPAEGERPQQGQPVQFVKITQARAGDGFYRGVWLKHDYAQQCPAAWSDGEAVRVDEAHGGDLEVGGIYLARRYGRAPGSYDPLVWIVDLRAQVLAVNGADEDLDAQVSAVTEIVVECQRGLNLYRWDGDSWELGGDGTGRAELSVQYATADYPGTVSATYQDFGGTKYILALLAGQLLADDEYDPLAPLQSTGDIVAGVADDEGDPLPVAAALSFGGHGAAAAHVGTTDAGGTVIELRAAGYHGLTVGPSTVYGMAGSHSLCLLNSSEMDRPPRYAVKRAITSGGSGYVQAGTYNTVYVRDELLNRIVVLNFAGGLYVTPEAGSSGSGSGSGSGAESECCPGTTLPGTLHLFLITETSPGVYDEVDVSLVRDSGTGHWVGTGGGYDWALACSGSDLSGWVLIQDEVGLGNVPTGDCVPFVLDFGLLYGSTQGVVTQ